MEEKNTIQQEEILRLLQAINLNMIRFDIRLNKLENKVIKIYRETCLDLYKP